MSQTAIEFVQQTAEGNWRLCGTRVSLDSIVRAWWDGQSPEAVSEEFPTVTVAQVYGVIAFYLQNKDEIDRYLLDQDQQWEELRLQSEARNAALLNRIRARRKPTTDEDQS